MTTTSTFVGGVLAGGASRRMGRDKSLIEIDGRPLVARPIDALRTAGAARILVVGGALAIGDLGVEHVPDDLPGEGPLMAIVQALRALGGGDVAVILACDLPRAAASEVINVVAACDGSCDVAIPVVDGRRQWLHAAWGTGALDHLEHAVERGERSVRGGARGLRVVEVAPIDPRALTDVDRPEHLARYAHRVPPEESST